MPTRPTRRRFTGALIGSLALGGRVVPASEAPAPRRPRIAFLGTALYEHSHAQHFLDRFVQGYAFGGRWVAPRLDVAGVYLDQFPANDLGRERLARHGLRLCPTVAEALTLGTGSLAVDGVVIIAEHGDYPKTAKGQTRYPRHAWFKEVVSVFERSGRAVPVFNDKHLATDWNECREMVADARRLRFPFSAGSSLPVTWRLPALELPLDVPLSESVCVAYGGVDSYDFHALEASQCMSERRRGGETGLRSVQALTGPQVYDALAARDATRRLFLAALCRSHTLPVAGGYPTAPVGFEWARAALPTITGYFLEHRDGFRTSVFMTGIQDFNYAGLRADTDEIVGCQMMLPFPRRGATTADFFNPLVRHVEEMILTGRTDQPVERTLLTSGMVIGAVDSLAAGGAVIDTPEMAVAYHAPRESMFWRE